MFNKRYINIIKQRSKKLFPLETDVAEDGVIKSSIKCVLFDVYGTLFVSGSGDLSITKDVYHTKEMGELLLKYGLRRDPEIIYKSYINSIKMEHNRLKAKGIDYPEVKIDRIWKAILNVSIFKARKIAVEYEMIVNPVWPMPGVIELLSQLKRKGVLLGIISNAQFYTPLMFKALLGKSLSELGFLKEIVFFSYRYGVAKPSTKLFALANNRLRGYGLKPENTVYIGNDILNDIKPASEIGFKTILFAGDKRSLRLREGDESCRNVKPDVIITSLTNFFNRINWLY